MTTPPLLPLTNQERRVYEFAAEGLTNNQIASRMKIRPATVRSYLRRAFAKTQTRSRAQMVAVVMAADHHSEAEGREITPPPFLPLTNQERRAYGFAAEGLTNNQIASRMKIRPATVSTYLRRAFAKTQTRSRAQMVAVVMAADHRAEG